MKLVINRVTMTGSGQCELNGGFVLLTKSWYWYRQYWVCKYWHIDYWYIGYQQKSSIIHPSLICKGLLLCVCCFFGQGKTGSLEKSLYQELKQREWVSYQFEKKKKQFPQSIFKMIIIQRTFLLFCSCYSLTVSLIWFVLSSPFQRLQK